MFKLLQIIGVILSIYYCQASVAQTNDEQKWKGKEADELFKRAIAISSTHQDSSILILKQCKELYAAAKDTSQLIESLIALTEIQKTYQNYKAAYKNIWELLSLTQQYGDLSYLVEVYDTLGNLYREFGQEAEAELSYKKSISYSKQLHDGSQETGQSLISAYYNLVMFYNGYNKLELAHEYLDSCLVLSDQLNLNKVKRAYLITERGYMYAKTQNYHQAETLLLEAKSIFENIEVTHLTYKSEKRYLVFIYFYLGNTYMWQNKNELAAYYLDQSLKAVETYKNHYTIKPTALHHLSTVHARLDNYREAYLTLLNSDILKDSLFCLNSTSNTELFRIQDKYQQEIDKHAKLLELEEKKRLQIMIYAFVFAILLLIIFLIFRNKQLKKIHRIRQENDKNLLRIKNKELTSYTLRFIEKEKTISELRSLILEKLPEEKKKLDLITQSNNNYWEEFDARFVSVNQRFYKVLSERYPKLTTGDLRNCALLKLNFSTREIADIQGISLSSVHTSQHRLRTKMGLSRDVNLGTFINSISG